MGAFLTDAESILEAAHAASLTSEAPTDFTFLIGSDGGIQMLANCDWPLSSLAAHHGARTLYRVRHRTGHVAVEGQSGNRHCRLEAETPQSVARRLLAGPTPALRWNA